MLTHFLLNSYTALLSSNDMRSVNLVILLGNATRDAELHPEK